MLPSFAGLFILPDPTGQFGMTFDQIIGHQQQKDIFRRAIQSGRLAHAYLFEGPEGVGKKLMATAIARALCCHEQVGCGSCAACRKIDHRNHPDMHLVDPEGNGIKIEQIRRLIRELNYRPVEARKKICIIDQADSMNQAAGNALLKTLEEPPGDAVLILLSSHPERLLPTIRSRCQRVAFQRLAQQQVLEVLNEQLGIDEQEASVLAAVSEGSFARIATRDREGFSALRNEVFSWFSNGSLADAAPRMRLAEELDRRKEDIPGIVEVLQTLYRDALHLILGRGDKAANVDATAIITQLAGQETALSLLDKISALDSARRQLEHNVNRQLALNVLLERLAA
ncbi:MAG: DNA polymerase III subunit delta' [Deltaproteobacteria bacterium]|nr:MAG: DNA polymerase III subunit delta' [Deltaproteobacteria bacterium]